MARPEARAGMALMAGRGTLTPADNEDGCGRDLEQVVVLERIVEAARDLVDARYAALGVLDPTATHLIEFTTMGLDAARQELIGELPKGHRILGLLIAEPTPIRLRDLREHPACFGFPPNHPAMKSFLGVPLFVRGKAFGNLYLTDKRNELGFSDIDEELALGLAAPAALAIENSRLHQQARELSALADRERIGRDLHNTVVQRRFATGPALDATVRVAVQPEVTPVWRTAARTWTPPTARVDPRSSPSTSHAALTPAAARTCKEGTGWAT